MFLQYITKNFVSQFPLTIFLFLVDLDPPTRPAAPPQHSIIPGPHSIIVVATMLLTPLEPRLRKCLNSLLVK